MSAERRMRRDLSHFSTLFLCIPFTLWAILLSLTTLLSLSPHHVAQNTAYANIATRQPNLMKQISAASSHSHLMITTRLIDSICDNQRKQHAPRNTIQQTGEISVLLPKNTVRRRSSSFRQFDSTSRLNESDDRKFALISSSLSFDDFIWIWWWIIHTTSRSHSLTQTNTTNQILQIQFHNPFHWICSLLRAKESNNKPKWIYKQYRLADLYR